LTIDRKKTQVNPRYDRRPREDTGMPTSSKHGGDADRPTTSALHDELARVEAHTLQLRDQLAQVAAARAEHERKLRAAQAQADGLRAQLAVASNDADAATAKLQNASSEHASIQSRGDMLRMEIRRLMEDIRLGEEEEAHVQEERRQLEHSAQERMRQAEEAAQSRRDEASERLAAARANLESVQAVAEGLQAELQKRAQLEEHLHRLRSVLTARKAMQQHQELTAALQEARSTLARYNEDMAAANRSKESLQTTMASLDRERAQLRDEVMRLIASEEESNAASLELGQRAATEGAALMSASAMVERFRMSYNRQ
jgi:chromosome segregation ATPase